MTQLWLKYRTGDMMQVGGELIKPEIKKNAELFLLEPFDVVYT